MRHPYILVIAAANVASAVAVSGALSHKPQESRFRASSAAVTVDVVVRDQRGRAITDLGRPDFQVLEDGVPQQIGDATLVADSSQSASKDDADVAHPSVAASGGAPVVSAPAATFVALVFDRLSAEARALTHKSALTFLEAHRPQDFVGVFLSDLSLVTVQTYTTDPVRLRKAIDEVASRATANFERMRIGPRSYGDPDPGTPPTASPESEGIASRDDPAHTRTVDPGATPAMDLVAMTRRMERAYEAMARDQQGHATINSLLAVVAALGELPGRKSVIFFAEALAIPPNVQSQFESVVATANQFNVSVYSVDAAGLRVHSGQSETGRRVNATGAQAMERDPDKPAGKLTEALELNEDNLRRDPGVSLRLLAERTGGFLIDTTNDLASGLRRIDEDRRFHYVLTYIPANTDFRGEWRRIEVRVPNRKVTVRARSGYIAVRTPGALPLLSYEGPALAALERTPLPSELPVHGSALIFPQSSADEARVALLVATDGANLTQHVDKSKPAAQTDFTILARVRDVNGDVVRKGSQRYRLPPDLHGEVLFFRQPTLAPGSYTVEYVVHDALGQRAGGGTVPATVPSKQPGQPQVSSVFVVQRTERVPANQRDATNPLFYGELLLYPNLGEPISKRQTQALTFALTIIPGSSSLRASLTLSQGERAIGETSLQLGQADAQGRIWNVGQLPLANLAPGEYTLTVRVAAGTQTQARRASFRVVE